MSSDHAAADPAQGPRSERVRASARAERAEHAEDAAIERDLEASLVDFPLLDGDGMVAGRGGSADAAEPEPLIGPSLLLPGAVTGIGVALTVLTVLETVRSVPVDGQARPLTAPLLAAALALGGFSLTRVLQLLHLARSRARGHAAGAELPPVRWQLVDAHSLQAVWVIGVGCSIALMGMLGVWSMLDGERSGLEPGWPLLLVGGALALLTHVVRGHIAHCWQDAGDAG